MIQVSSRKQSQLQGEIARIQNFLDGFESTTNGNRTARLGISGEFVVIKNFPLPDGFSPDFIDMLVITDSFPAIPPIGIYVLNNENEALINQLSSKFNAFRDRAFHDAPAIPGYTWVCYHYANNSWRYRPDNPCRGDNIAKFLSGFFAELSK
ncbi:hypothetical protein D8T63_15920 [Vibrio vulnificus]|uniref:hypothetical protein n=1 Tax=Vibrio vulnificus TaxID=672 RepID=UPI00102A3B63|nr:hypothetical protein [Vibrio vulnificus]RZR24224.1 hypothetical protein D8T63_15920 [Vibrio vulnificus]